MLRVRVKDSHSTGSRKVCQQFWNKHLSCWWQTENQLLRSNPAEKHADDRTCLQPATVGGPVIDTSCHSTFNVQDTVRKHLVTVFVFADGHYDRSTTEPAVKRLVFCSWSTKADSSRPLPKLRMSTYATTQTRPFTSGFRFTRHH